MKQKFISLFLIFCFMLAFGQDKTYDLLEPHTETKILYDRVFPVAKAYDLKTQKVSTEYYKQVYNEMQRADFQQRLPKLDFLREQADLGFSQNQIPLSLLINDFEMLDADALNRNKMQMNSKNQIEFKNFSKSDLNKYSINLLAPILAKTKSNSPEFILKNELVFNTTSRKIDFIEVENNRIWKKINFDQPFRIDAPENGVKTVNYKIHFIGGEILSQSFIINVDYQNYATVNKGKPFSPNVVNTFTSSRTYKGYGESSPFAGIGEYEVFLDTVDGVLDKPIILLDGFDPGDARNTSQIYQLLNYGSGQNLGDVVRAQGYDLIVLNFPKYTRPGTTTVIDGGTDYIQRNAMLLLDLIEMINAQKVGTAKNVVIGPSMGGLVSRYALRYMEQNSLNPDTRLYISFDSPHLGANVPIGFQHLFNYMGFGPLGDVTMQDLVSGMLKTPAAKEMLLDHFEGHLKAGSATEFETTSASLLPVGSPNFRTPFQTELDGMGFPLTTRNVAIINGAGNGTMTGTPGMNIMDHTFNASSTQRAIIKLNYTPIANQTLEVSRFKGQQWIFVWITGYESAASSRTPTTSAGLDTAPGGRFDISALAASAGESPILTEFLTNLKIGYFNFIPAISGMAVSNTNNYYSNINSSSTTPFAAYSIPTVNENHVTFNPENVQFALDEIYADDGTLATQQNPIQQLVIENPVKQVLKIKSNYILRNADVTLSDMSGKRVFNKTFKTISGNLEIPMSVTKGIYILTISSGKEKITKKVMVTN